MLDDVCGGEVVLDQLGDDAFAGDEVGHGDMGHGDDAFGDGVGDGRDAIDDDKGIADQGRLDGGGAAGDDGGAGVKEGTSGAAYCGTCGGANCAFGAALSLRRVRMVRFSRRRLPTHAPLR